MKYLELYVYKMEFLNKNSVWKFSVYKFIYFIELKWEENLSIKYYFYCVITVFWRCKIFFFCVRNRDKQRSLVNLALPNVRRRLIGKICKHIFELWPIFRHCPSSNSVYHIRLKIALVRGILISPLIPQILRTS